MTEQSVGWHRTALWSAYPLPPKSHQESRQWAVVGPLHDLPIYYRLKSSMTEPAKGRRRPALWPCLLIPPKSHPCWPLWFVHTPPPKSHHDWAASGPSLDRLIGLPTHYRLCLPDNGPLLARSGLSIHHHPKVSMREQPLGRHWTALWFSYSLLSNIHQEHWHWADEGPLDDLPTCYHPKTSMTEPTKGLGWPNFWISPLKPAQEPPLRLTMGHCWPAR